MQASGTSDFREVTNLISPLLLSGLNSFDESTVQVLTIGIISYGRELEQLIAAEQSKAQLFPENPQLIENEIG